MNLPVTKKQLKMARAVAIAADVTQIILVPFFVEGFFSPLNDLLDIAVCATLSSIIGFHWSFLPAAVIEDLPVLDEIPTWTLAVLIATSDMQMIHKG